jgi:hypothetical protein
VDFAKRSLGVASRSCGLPTFLDPKIHRKKPTKAPHTELRLLLESEQGRLTPMVGRRVYKYAVQVGRETYC